MEEVTRVVELLDHQADIAADTSTPVLVLEGGLGSGKTTTALVFIVRQATLFPGVAGLVVEPTNDLVGSILLPACDKLLGEWGIPFAFRRSWRGRPNVLVLWPDDPERCTPVYLRSGDRPERIVGFDVGWFVVDEADSQDAEVWRRCMGRRRSSGVVERGGVMQALAVYTPEPGFNWTWSLFHEKRTAGMRVIEGVATTTNVFNPRGYDDDLRSSHDDVEIARVTEGKRSSRNGLVFRRFDEKRNVARCAAPFDGNVEVWCDFNVAKMAWSFVSITPRGAHVFAELVREDTDTMAQADEAAKLLALWLSVRRGANEAELRQKDPERWPVTPKAAARGTTVICDAAGENASTSSTRSDAEIIRQVGFTVRHQARNPFIADSVLAVNAALADGWLRFDKDKAPYVTRCISQIPYGADGQPAKGTGSREKVKAGLDHGADTIRYGVWFHRPVHLRRGNQA